MNTFPQKQVFIWAIVYQNEFKENKTEQVNNTP